MTSYSGSQRDVTIPDEVTYKSNTYIVVGIGSKAFDGNTTLQSVTIPYGVTYIDWDAFCGCTGLTSVSISETVKIIEGYAFLGCTGLTSFTIPEGVEEIGQQTFYDCTGLVSVTIPSTMTEIYIGAFSGCTSMKDVYCFADPDKLTWRVVGGAFHRNDKDTKIHVKANQLNKYEAKWSTGAITDVNATFVGDLDCPVLTDGEPYTRTIESKVNTVTYQKTLGSERVGKHQAWLVPFDYTITAADLAKFSFYKINMIANSPSPEVEASDEVWVILTKMEAGSKMYANMPYVYMPLEAVTDYQFTSTNVKLKAPNAEVLAKTETMTDIYSFYATYANTAPRSGFDFYYVNIDGGLSYGFGDDSGVTVGPYRWIVRPENKRTYDYYYDYAREMHFYDGEGTTGIEHTLYEGKLSDGWYTLDGRKLTGTPSSKGIYIHNGRKEAVR